jgi:predicted HicB family RNase H-like nuclease
VVSSGPSLARRVGALAFQRLPYYSCHTMSNKARGQMTKILAVRVDPELKAALEKAAAADNRTISNLVVKVLRDYLAKHPRSKVRP